MSIRRVPIELASVIHHAVEASAPLLDNAGLTHTVVVPDLPIYIEADAARLAQVIGNILNNASKFTPQGGSVVLVVELDGSEAVVRIRDTGIGIDAADLPRVFEMFVQTAGSLDGKGGLGIGLALARSLVERHDGRLTIQSDGRGRGTEAIIRLPALATRPVTVSRAGETGPTSEVKPESRRVLVVDDNRDSANMMAMLLEFVGHQARTAHDGLKAVAEVAEFQPHVVLLDIGLPVLNGYEAAERIRRAPGIQPVLIALTGWGQPEDRRRAVDAGFDHHLIKPVDHDVLMSLVANVPADVGR